MSGTLTRSACLWPDKQVDSGNLWAEPQDLLKCHTAHKTCCTCMQKALPGRSGSPPVLTHHVHRSSVTDPRATPSNDFLQ